MQGSYGQFVNESALSFGNGLPCSTAYVYYDSVRGVYYYHWSNVAANQAPDCIPGYPQKVWYNDQDYPVQPGV